MAAKAQVQTSVHLQGKRVVIARSTTATQKIQKSLDLIIKPENRRLVTGCLDIEKDELLGLEGIDVALGKFHAPIADFAGPVVMFEFFPARPVPKKKEENVVQGAV